MMKINELDECIKGLTNTCFSGGAEGADRLFTLYALENGFDVVNFSFKRHEYKVPEDTILEIPSHILVDKLVLNQLNKANSSLNRKVPKPNSYVYSLLARNRYQVLNTDAIYCIAPLASPSQVQGGTAWAVQMYIDSTENPKIYCYDYKTRLVYSYDSSKKEFIEVLEIPKPKGNWTGIGSRNALEKHLEHFKTYFKD